MAAQTEAARAHGQRETGARAHAAPEAVGPHQEARAELAARGARAHAPLALREVEELALALHRHPRARGGGAQRGGEARAAHAEASAAREIAGELVRALEEAHTAEGRPA